MTSNVRSRSVVPLPFVDEGLGNSSYLVDLGDGRALVVDPARHPGGYLAAAQRLGLEVAYAVETHLHADFVSGVRELSALGASMLAPAEGHHGFAVHGLRDGDELDLGGLTMRALATPGHTPEHLSYLLLDGGHPVALFSGGSLLVDSVARTDLVAPDQTEPLARALWRSLQDRILVLPDDLAVYPTHGAGSFCSTPTGGERTTTIGRELAANPLLGALDEDAFVARLLGSLGSYPTYFERLREVNRRGPAVYGPDAPVLPQLRPAEVDRLARDGARVVDVRPVERFGGGHLPGSVSIALRPQFASWLGWVVSDDDPLVFVLDDDQDRAELVRQARNIGYERIVGELSGGVEAWQAAGLPVESTPVVPVALASGAVIDVRQRAEFEGGHLPGARNIELGSISTAAVDAGPLAVMCGHGERAMTAASLLAASGHREVTVLSGGPGDWAAEGAGLATGT